MKQYTFYNPTFEKLAEKLLQKREDLKEALAESDYNEKAFYLVKGQIANINDTLEVLEKEDQDQNG